MLQKVNSYLTEDEDEKAVDQGMKNSEKEENIDSKQSISEEIPAMTAEPKEDNTQIIQNSRPKLKVNDIIQYKLNNTDDWIKATVTGRAGKATGRNRNWYNIREDASEERKSINLDEVQWELTTANATVNLVSEREQSCAETTVAKVREVLKLKQFNTYEEVKNCGQYTLSKRWVITKKDGQIKARLVVRGFEEELIMRRDSQTAGKGTMRIFLAIVSCKNWTVKTTGKRSVFRRDVYIKPPKESETDEGVVWKLKHGLYGLKDGARQFYVSVKEELLKLWCKISEMDPAMFYLHKGDKLSGIV